MNVTSDLAAPNKRLLARPRGSQFLCQSILKQALSAQLVPQGPSDEPTSELLARIRAECEAAPPKRRWKKAKSS